MRQELIDTLAQLEALTNQRSALREAYLAEVSERMRQYRKLRRLRIDKDDAEIRWLCHKGLEQWELDCLYRPVNDKHRRLVDALDLDIRLTKARVETLTKMLQPMPGTHWRKLHKVYRGDYATQGYGAETYARNSAEMYLQNRAALCRDLGIELEIRKTVAPVAFEVWARVDADADVEILRRAQAPALRDWLKACWARGVNPRVYCPLPHGLEERLGLDCFGNDLRPEPATPNGPTPNGPRPQRPTPNDPTPRD